MSLHDLLKKEPAPRLLLEALKLYGVKEKEGKESNPVIMSWARELDLPYSSDEVPWCGLFLAWISHQAMKPIPKAPLWALNWATIGTEVKTPVLGDILIFRRQRGGHVGIYVAEDDNGFIVLGGNQKDSVSFARIEKGRLFAARHFYAVGQPANCRRIWVKNNTYDLSTDER